MSMLFVGVTVWINDLRQMIETQKWYRRWICTRIYGSRRGYTKRNNNAYTHVYSSDTVYRVIDDTRAVVK